MTLKGNGLNSVWNDEFSVASLAHTTIILRPKSSASTDAAAMVRILLHSPAVGWTIMGRFIIMKKMICIMPLYVDETKKENG